MALLIRNNTRGRLLVLLVLVGFLSVSWGQTDPVSSSDGTLNKTVAPTNATADEDDDAKFSGAEDLLPGLENPDIDGLVSNYILGTPEHYNKTYDPPGMVPKFNKLPRFSHSDDFSMLMGKKPNDYFLGLLFIGTFICSFFFFWGIIIWILKCIGPNRVGFLAGFPFREEGRKSAFGRIVLCFSCWVMIAATIVLITQGFTVMQSLSDTVDMAVTEIQIMGSEVQQIVTTLQVVAAKTTPIRDELVDFLKRDICPLEPGTDTEDMVRSVGEDTYDAMSELDDFIEGYLNDVESGVNQTAKFTDRIKGITDMAQFTNNWKVALVVFPYFIVPSFILVAVCMGWFDVFSEGFYTFITWVILPILIIQTIIAVISSSWIVIFLQANTDLCMPTPESTILNILDTVDLDPDSSTSESNDENGPNDNFFYDVMLFYTHQCAKPNPWQFLEGHYTDLARGKNILGEFLRSIADTTLGQLSQECGHEYGPIVELLLQLQELISILAQTSTRALNLMACQNVVPIYTTFIYDAACSMSPIGLTWMLSCSVVISFFGMIIIMFRGAYYPIDYYYYDEKDLYATSDDDSCDEIEEPLTDSDCNDIVLRQQRKQIEMTMELMKEDDHFDVYNDNEPKGDTDTDDNYDDSLVSTLGSTYGGGETSYSTGMYESNAESTTSGRSRESC